MLRWFQRVFGLGRGRAAAASPAVTPAWTMARRAEFARFLSSDTGQAFLSRFDAAANDVAARAVTDVMHTSHSAGHAAGFREAKLWIETLSRCEVCDKPANPNSGDPETTNEWGQSEARQLETESL
jgi:hypothetical protein